FADDIFNANPKRMKDLLRRMIAEGLTPQWGAQMRTEAANDDEMLDLMQKSNCFNVYVGFESINPKTLKLFQKKQDLAKIERSIERFHQYQIGIHGMFVVGSDEDDLETIWATADFAKERDIDSIQLMILTPIPGSPDWDHLYARGERYVISSDWSLYDGHHTVHQPRRISPYELQMAAIKAMGKFYSWGGIFRRLLQKDVYYAAIRYYGKKMLKEWWKDQENRAYVEKLKSDLYDAAPERIKGRTVGIPEAFVQDGMGALLRRFLGELGVQVIPFVAESNAGDPSYAEVLHRFRQTADCLILPVVKKAKQGKEELYRKLNALNTLLQANTEKLPRIIHFPVNDEQGPIFESFAKVGFAFTGNMKRIRKAFQEALNALEARNVEGQMA
ncbi:MAG: B12-binding domain-containing radical SAM protein, partial [candidate division NC10 bacterium]|nr:B12-binding domain-containing radical SAM protein [candidate division NC10 bacterium]